MTEDSMMRKWTKKKKTVNQLTTKEKLIIELLFPEKLNIELFSCEGGLSSNKVLSKLLEEKCQQTAKPLFAAVLVAYDPYSQFE